jgi:hypothetical protein
MAEERATESARRIVPAEATDARSSRSREIARLTVAAEVTAVVVSAFTTPRNRSIVSVEPTTTSRTSPMDRTMAADIAACASRIGRI